MPDEGTSASSSGAGSPSHSTAAACSKTAAKPTRLQQATNDGQVGISSALSPVTPTTKARLDRIDDEIKTISSEILLYMQAKMSEAQRTKTPLQVSPAPYLDKEMRLGKLREEREIITEERRVSAVVAVFNEHHPRQIEECPLCLDHIEINEWTKFAYMPCCHRITCYDCLEKCVRETDCSCPFCKRDKGVKLSDEERIDMMITNAEDHDDKIAQLLLFECTEGSAKYEKERSKWLLASADQGYGRALFRLGLAYTEGDVDGIEPCPEKARECLRRSAELGDVDGQYNYNYALIQEGDTRASKRMLTVAAASGSSEQGCLLAQHALGLHYLCAEQDMGSNHRAMYWFELAASGGHHKSNFYMAYLLADCAEKRYELHGCPCYAGDDSLTRAIFLAREATQKCKDAGEVLNFKESSILEDLETKVGSYCAYCYRTGKKLMGCGRCKTAFYCSKDCQLMHRKIGHKLVCKK